jgi:hypothetical protein
MWHINAITVSDGSNSTIFGGLGSDQMPRQLGDRLGPQNSTYVVSIAGSGAIFLEDVGAIGGPGQWAVQINNSDSYWYYNDEGELQLSVDSDGVVTFSGGVQSATADLLVNMIDMNTLLPPMFTMVSQSSALQSQWNANAMETLYSMGFPETSMLNMDEHCCQQFIDALQSIVFGSEQLGVPGASGARKLFRSGDFGQWLSDYPELGVSWGCTFCKIAIVAVVTIFVAMAALAIAMDPPLAVFVAGIAPDVTAIAASEATGVSTQVLATITMGASFAGQIVLSDVLEGLCQYKGYCSGLANESKGAPVLT